MDITDVVAMARANALWHAAGSAIIFYDHLTTLDQEIELIWLREWSFTSLLFLSTRYVGEASFVHASAGMWASGRFLDIVSPSMFQVQSCISQIAILAMNAIIVKRVVCMYNGDKRVLCVLAVALFILAVYSLVLTILTSNPESVLRVQFTYPFETCHRPMELGPVPMYYWSFIYAFFPFEVLVFGLSLVQGLKFIREKRWQARRAREKAGGSGVLGLILWKTRRDLASVLLRDSILFPFINLIFAALNIMAWRAQIPSSLTQGIRLFSLVSVPTIGCRLILNLRDAYYKPFRDEYDQSRYLPHDSLVIPGLQLELDESEAKLGGSASRDLTTGSRSREQEVVV
ncbi:hypothetical protein BKA70DRAFT_514778 [Coprinopsis sp. MPI-PUGE-AT-0042]|nr:hypothetical protein BKA70DRAFT_514778 [Coprinopsis sp. MPI-PUGE-AT-0042]